MTIPSFNLTPGESPSALAQRRRIAELLLRQGMDTSPIQSPWQGAARVAQAMMGGYELHRADKSDLATGKKIADAYVPETPASPMAAAAPAASSPSPTGVQRVAAAMPSTAGKVYENNEPSPLDPPAGGERDLAVRTVLAEAGNQGPTGMQAVANVIRNRAVQGNFGGDTPTGVITKPYQFEPLNTAAGRQRMAGIDPNSPQYQAADQAVARAYTGDDPTRGATHFYSPTAQTALGRPAPSWDNGQGVDIGQHRFFGGAGGPPVTAGASPTDVSAQRAQPSPAAPPTAAPAAARNAPQIPPELQARLRALIMDPSTREYGLQIAQQYIKPSQATFGVIGKDEFNREQYGWIDPLRQTTTPAAGAAPAAPQGERAIPPAPPGVDPKIWRDEQSKRTVQNAMPASWDDTAKLRGEVRQLPSYKNLAEATPIYKTMLDSAGRNSKASDLNLVYGLGKIFDPGSVVREGEMVMVKNTAGIPDWLVGTINALNGGAALTPETREAIMREAHSRIQSYKQTFDQDAGQYRGIAERNRMNTADVMPDFGEFQPWTPPQTAPAGAAPAAAPAQPGRVRKFNPTTGSIE